MEANAVVEKPRQWWSSTREFFRDTTGEMKKVTWPTRNEVVGTTIVVLVATVLFALYLWGCDTAFFWMTQKLFDYFGATTT